MDTVGRRRKAGETRQHARGLTFGQVRQERHADHIGPALAEGVAKNVVHICQAALQILADDKIALRANEIAIPLLALGNLPFLIAQGFEARLQEFAFRAMGAGARRCPAPRLHAEQKDDGKAQQQNGCLFEGERHEGRLCLACRTGIARGARL